MATGEETEKERGNPAQRQHQEEEQELQHQQQKEERKPTRLRQATLNWPARGVGKKDISMNGETRVEKKQEVEESTWMMGGREEDNERYRAFLLYCEERREDTKLRDEGENKRKEEARRKEEHWKLLRVCKEDKRM